VITAVWIEEFDAIESFGYLFVAFAKLRTRAPTRSEDWIGANETRLLFGIGRIKLEPSFRLESKDRQIARRPAQIGSLKSRAKAMLDGRSKGSKDLLDRPRFGRQRRRTQELPVKPNSETGQQDQNGDY
jgi:hypothetical protein